jgi:hypothetical protein
MRLRNLLLVGALAFCALAAGASISLASSHREAPLITTMPKVDGTDWYAFNSYEPGRSGYVTLIADYQPLEDPFAGPNYYTMDPNAHYDININNRGSAIPQIIYRFRFTNTIQKLTVPVNGVNVQVPLVNIGPISTGDTATSNVVETYQVQIISGGRTGNLTDTASGSTTFTKPTDNIGNKTFSSPADYEAYADQYIYTVNIPGCSQTGRVFVGQRKDPFVVNLGEAFDLVNISNPIGPPNEATDALAGKNVTAIEMEVPAACLTENSSQPIIGSWTSAEINKDGGWQQVSRLGNPLFNELVIGLNDKDKFNASLPIRDAQFLQYVTNPTFPALVQALFPSVTAPTLFPRSDLVATFLTGISGLNQPPRVIASEMMRLNTSTPVTPAASQNRLGALGGDLAGYPNGRRPGDDVVDITLQVAMGALINAGSFGFGKPSQAPSGNLPFTDGAYLDSTFFSDAFPYLRTPIPGSPNGSVPDNNGLPVDGAQFGGV